MSKTTLTLIIFVLTALIFWGLFFYLPSLKDTTEAENKALKAKNKEIESKLVSSQKILDSLAKNSIFWETKFYAQLNDTIIKIKYIGIREKTSGLGRDDSVVRFNDRTNERLGKGSH